MSSNGRYVRAPEYLYSQSSDDECEQGTSPTMNNIHDSDNESVDNRNDIDLCSDFVHPVVSGVQGQDLDNIQDTVSQVIDPSAASGCSKTSTDSNEQRLQRMENALFDITKAIHSMQTTRATPYIPDADQNWCTPVSSSGDIALPSIRWDNIKPFPSGVPANKMWEEWNRYIENFEIAASLSNANDPVRRTQLLFLSIGDELQNIVRAAKLKPSLNDAGCYRNFVDNIRKHFQSMTDSAAEHEAFSNMRQDRSESAIAFHARLTAKVRLCGYSSTDQDRFVRAQLLKGLRNRELVKAARTYGHDTNYIVQAATRDEAYEAETAIQASSQPFEQYAINRVQRQSPRQPSYRESSSKRPRPGRMVDRTESKRFRNNQQAPRRDLQERGRRARCRRCNGLPHSNYPCPALNRNCNSCGERGHYAAACRQSRIRHLQIKSNDSPTRDNNIDHAQVLND